MTRALPLLAVFLFACPSEDPAPVFPTDYTLEVVVDRAREDADMIPAAATVTLNEPAVDPVIVYLHTDGLFGLELLGDAPPILPGEREAVIGLRVRDNSSVAPDRTHTIFVNALGLVERSFTFTVEDDEPRTLILEGPANLTEGASSQYLTLQTAGPVDEAVTLTFQVEPAGLIELQPEISMVGPAFRQLAIVVPDDGLLLPGRSVTITATPDHLLEAPAPLTLEILDDEPTTLALEALVTGLAESAGIVSGGARLSLGAVAAEAITIELHSSDPSALSVPTQVTVPAQGQSVTFDLTVLDDMILDGDTVVTLTASAPSLETTTLAVPIADDEVAGPQLIGPTSTVKESDGTLAGWGTLSLGVTTATDLSFSLSSSDESELTVPATLLIPAGGNRASFDLTVLDDAVLDFERTVTVSASSLAGAASLIVGVTDDEPNDLGVTVSATEVWESSGALPDVVSVHTTVPVEAPLRIDLASSDPAELDVQLFVTLPAGQTSVPVDIYAVVGADGTPDGDKVVQLTASATGCTGATGSITILDEDRGYAVELLQSAGVEQWVGFPGMPGLIYDTDWALAERFLIPVGADTFGYQFFRGNAFLDLWGDFSINVNPDTTDQVTLFRLPMTMEAGQNGVTLTRDTWHTLVVQYDKNTQLASLYVDGIFMSEGTAPNAPWDDRTNDNPLVWGGQYAEPQYGTGELYLESDVTFAHMAIWQRQLSAAEIAAYDGSVDTTDPDLAFSSVIGNGQVWDEVGGTSGTVHGAASFYRP